MKRHRRSGSSVEKTFAIPSSGISFSVQSGSAGMTRFRRFNFCRSRLGSIFFAVLVAGLILFAISYFQGYSRWSQSVIMRDNDYDMSDPGVERKLSNQQRMELWKKFHFDEEEDDLQICKVPKLSLNSDVNKDVYYEMPPLECKSEHLMYIKNGVLTINETVLNGRMLARCDYRAIEWETDNYVSYTKVHSQTESPYAIKVKHDFFRVQCFLEKEKNSEKVGPNFAAARRLLQDESVIRATPNFAQRQENLQNLKKYGEKNFPRQEMRKEENAVEENEQPRMLGSMNLPDPIPPKKAAKKSYNKNLQMNDISDKVARLPKGINDSQNRKLSKVAPMSQEKQHIPRSNMAAEKVDQKVPEFDPIVNKEAVDFNADLEDENDLDPRDMDYESDLDLEADFDQFVAQIYPTEHIMQRVNEAKPNPNSLQMNVLMLVMDSMSHLSYQRKMPKTYSFLQEELDAVILNGYNIVGDATTAAMIPLLTGKNESELPEVRRSKSKSTFVDSYPLLWYKFDRNGYVTLYAEDDPGISTFNLRFNGFEEVPTDHYMRPFWLAAAESELKQQSERYCLGGQPVHRYLLDYIRQFFVRYKKIPKYALGFMNTLSHSDNNPAEYADEDVVKLLTFLKKTKNLDNTLVVVMGDHGARYSAVRHTIQGKMEERLPMMALAFPKWFQEKYTKLMQNLRRNIDRLTTPYDIHETIQSLLDFKGIDGHREMDYESRGLNLLHEVPLNRTCKSAHIDMHWCTCMQWKEVKKDTYDVRKSVEEILKYINELTKDYRNQCQELRVKKVLEAKIIMPNEKVLTFLKSPDPDQRIANFSSIDEVKLDIIHYQIILETSPNNGMYEGTVLADHNAGTYKLTAEPSRLNIYGSQPACVMDTHPELLKYCYCKNQGEHDL